VGISKKPLHLSSTIAVLFTPEADPYQKLCQNNNDDNRFLVSLRQMSASQAVVLTDYFVSPLRVCVANGAASDYRTSQYTPCGRTSTTILSTPDLVRGFKRISLHKGAVPAALNRAADCPGRPRSARAIEVSYLAAVIHLATGKPEQVRDIHPYGTTFSPGVSIRPLYSGVIAHVSNGCSMKFTRCPD
jgi:hypothetical protein